MRILHTADIHLRSEKDERWEALRKIIELAGKEKADIIAVSGDLFDRGVDAEKLRPRARDLFSGVDFDIVLIPGNHDSDSYGSGLFFGDNIKILDDPETPFIKGDVRIWGMPFEDAGSADMARKLRSLSEQFDPEKTDILLYHGELLDSFYSRSDFGEEGDRRYMPAKLSFFGGLKLDYVLAGHFHTRFRVWEMEGGGYFVYPGSPVSITRRETGKRSVNILEVGEGPAEHHLDTPYFESLEVSLDPFSGADPEEEVRKAIEPLPPGAAILLTVRGYINSDEEGLSESDLVDRIRKITGDKLEEADYLFRDIGVLINDPLFESFKNKLEERGFGEELTERVREVAIRAMMEGGQ